VGDVVQNRICHVDGGCSAMSVVHGGRWLPVYIPLGDHVEAFGSLGAIPGAK
jgi:hypothetical protein